MLTLSPLCWLKLQLFLHGGDTEIGGFAVSRSDNLLYLHDFVTVRQEVTAVTVAFDDGAVADYFDAQVDGGLAPERFGRVWVHTHPGESPDPSSVDEQTFHRVFGACDWAIMLIVSRTGKTYCRLSFSAGPGGAMLLPVRVDWSAWPQLLLDQAGALSALFEAWMDEYGANVIPLMPPTTSADRSSPIAWSGDWWAEDDLYGPLEGDYAPFDLDDCRDGSDTLMELFGTAGEVVS